MAPNGKRVQTVYGGADFGDQSLETVTAAFYTAGDVSLDDATFTPDDYRKKERLSGLSERAYFQLSGDAWSLGRLSLVSLFAGFRLRG